MFIGFIVLCKSLFSTCLQTLRYFKNTIPPFGGKKKHILQKGYNNIQLGYFGPFVCNEVFNNKNNCTRNIIYRVRLSTQITQTTIGGRINIDTNHKSHDLYPGNEKKKTIAKATLINKINEYSSQKKGCNG